MIATVSLIDEELRTSALTNLNCIVKRGVAHEHANAYYESLKYCRVPQPHEVAENSSFDSTDLSAQIGPNRLEGRGQGKYGLHIEDKDCVLELDITSSNSAILNGDNGLVSLGSFRMNYYSYPRVTISGFLNFKGRSLQVSGTGWLDHQWGDWFKFSETLLKDTNKTPNRITWQRFGIQLSNNLEINAIIPNDTMTKRPFQPSITVSNQSGQAMSLARIHTQSHKAWQSLRTLNIYPIGWTIKVPDLALSLVMEPAVHMELPAFGPIIGVLEALCRVRGRMGEGEIEGLCWAKTLGDTFDQGDFWKGQKQCINSELEKIIPKIASSDWLTRLAGQPKWKRDPTVYSETIIKPLWDLFNRGGKRWRPLWMSLCCDAVGGDSEKFRDLLPIPELFHTGSIIIDDIEDHSDHRRGDEALHIRYGTPIALNAGNALYYLPLLLLEENKVLTDKKRYMIYEIVSRSGRSAHLGQAADIYFGSEHVDLDALLKEYSNTKQVTLQICADKTGSQAKALAEIGGILGDGTNAQIEALANYSEVVGMTFQMINDISNLEHHQKGKRGEDIREGKLLFTTLEAIAMAKHSESQRLLQILKQRTEDQQLINEAITIIRKSGAIDATKQQLARFLEEKWNSVSPLLDESEAKIKLRAGPQWLLRQENLEAQL